jgi:hypothetical protein
MMASSTLLLVHIPSPPGILLLQPSDSNLNNRDISFITTPLFQFGHVVTHHTEQLPLRINSSGGMDLIVIKLAEAMITILGYIAAGTPMHAIGQQQQQARQPSSISLPAPPHSS